MNERIGSDSENAPARERGEPEIRFPEEPETSDSPARLPGDQRDDVLLIDDRDRYAGLRLISWWRQERLAQARVMVVGAGALGNEVLKNLALLGVGNVVLVDFDHVESSNLSRAVLFRDRDAGRPKAEIAAARVAEINPDTRVVPIVGNVVTEVGLGLFEAMDVVVGCLDNREARLWVNRQCWRVGVPWIDAGIQEIQGVVKVFLPPRTACYECAMTERDYQLLNLRYSCPLLRREDILQGKVPTAPTIASMMAAIQVQEALKILHGLPVEGGVAHVFNGVSNSFYTTRLPFKDDCLSHETLPPAVPLPLGRRDSLASLFRAARRAMNLGDGPLTLHLDRDLVVEIEHPASGRRRPVMLPASRVSMLELVDPSDGSPGRPVMLHMIEEGSDFENRPLAELGVPPFDALRVEGTNGLGLFRLESDRPTELPPRPRLANGERAP